MSKNPFTDKLLVGEYKNMLEFAQVAFNKAIMGQYPAKIGTEAPRFAIINYEGAGHQNDYVNLDDATFYCSEWNDIKLWIGVTDIYPDPDTNRYTYFHSKTLSIQYARIMEDGSIIIFIPHISVDTPENTIKAVAVMYRYLQEIKIMSKRSDMIDTLTNIYTVANFFYRVFGINLLLEENFFQVFGQDNTDAIYLYGGPNQIQRIFKFLQKDSQYVKPISNSDIDYYRVLGAMTRFNREVRGDIMQYKITNHTDNDIDMTKFKDILSGSDTLDGEDVDQFYDSVMHIILEDYDKPFSGAPYPSVFHLNVILSLIPKIAILIYNEIDYDGNTKAEEQLKLIEDVFALVEKKIKETAAKEGITDSDVHPFYYELRNNLYTYIFFYLHMFYSDVKYLSEYANDVHVRDEDWGAHSLILTTIFSTANNRYQHRDEYQSGLENELCNKIIADHYKDIFDYLGRIQDWANMCDKPITHEDDSNEPDSTPEE